MTGATHGECDPDPKWTVVDGGYAPMNLDPGDTITFKYHAFAHDVVSLPTKADLDGCEFTNKVELCNLDGSSAVDGTVTTEGGKLSYVWTPTANGVYYIS